MAIELTVRSTLELRGADPELKEYLRELLTILNPLWLDAKNFGRWTGNVPKYITQYKEENGVVTIPRGILVHLIQDLGREFRIKDLRVAPKIDHPWPDNSLVLRPGDQEPAIEKLLGSESGFLSAPPGSGKTVMGLEACRRLGLRALWLTHRKELKDQAIERAQELFRLPKEEIGVLHASAWKIGDQLTVGMVPTLRKRDLSPIRDSFGTIVVDEAHHVPSSTFLQVVEQFAALHLYGLTATAYRRDKLDSIMFNAMGPIVSTVERIQLVEDLHVVNPLIRIRHTHWLPPGNAHMEHRDFMDAMVKDRIRNNLIVGDILQECQPGNTCIVLVERTKHAEILTAMLKERGAHCEFVVGSIDVEESTREEGKKKKKAIPKDIRNRIIRDFKEGRLQVLVATYELLAEGFDYKPLNRLFLATPVKWRGKVTQAVGRVQRPHESKTDAIVYDYVDSDISMFWKQGESRTNGVYKPLGMEIELL